MLIICAACGQPIEEGEEMENRHWGHEPNCPRHSDPDAEGCCNCDLEYHEECCPDCLADEEVDGEGLMYYEWLKDILVEEPIEEDDDDTGLYQCLCEDMVGHLGKCPMCGGQIIPF